MHKKYPGASFSKDELGNSMIGCLTLIKQFFSHSLRSVLTFLVFSFLLASCGGGGESPNFSIGGQVSGLAQGSSVTLQNNGQQVTITSNGTHTFVGAIPQGGSYNVTVVSQSPGQTCSIAGNSGAGAGVNSNVTTVRIVCSVFSYAIGGSISGLQGGSATLLNNGGDALTVSANGSFTFATPVAFGGSYAVTIPISNQPVGQTCSASGNTGSGSGINATVTSVIIVCATQTFSVGGSVSDASNTVTLNLNKGAEFLSVGNGPFSFNNRIAFGSGYNVTVGTDPVGQTCTVNNGVGETVTANITNINVLCSTNTFTIGGQVTGLQGTVTLNLNGGSPLSIGIKGPFTFGTPVSFGGNYSVTVATQPLGQTCVVNQGAGTSVTANVTNIGVSCTENVYTIGGSISGLPVKNSVQLTLSTGGYGQETINARTGFIFSTSIPAGVTYSVSVAEQPNSYNCTVANASGTIQANVTNVEVTCVSTVFSVSGVITGLTQDSVTLRPNPNDAANEITVAIDTNFAFSWLLSQGTTYQITVISSPIGKLCGVQSGGTGTVNGDVNNIVISCTDSGPIIN
jgi:hypothetical protein